MRPPLEGQPAAHPREKKTFHRCVKSKATGEKATGVVSFLPSFSPALLLIEEPSASPSDISRGAATPRQEKRQRKARCSLPLALPVRALAPSARPRRRAARAQSAVAQALLHRPKRANLHLHHPPCCWHPRARARRASRCRCAPWRRRGTRIRTCRTRPRAWTRSGSRRACRRCRRPRPPLPRPPRRRPPPLPPPPPPPPRLSRAA